MSVEVEELHAWLGDAEMLSFRFNQWMIALEKWEAQLSEIDTEDLKRPYAIKTQERIVEIHKVLFQTKWSYGNKHLWNTNPPKEGLLDEEYLQKTITCDKCEKVVREIKGTWKPRKEGDFFVDYEFNCSTCHDGE
jgi:hypothetical protein